MAVSKTSELDDDEIRELRITLAAAEARIAEMEAALEATQLSYETSLDITKMRISELEAALATARPQWRRELRDGQQAWRPDVNLLEQLNKK